MAKQYTAHTSAPKLGVEATPQAAVSASVQADLRANTATQREFQSQLQASPRMQQVAQLAVHPSPSGSSGFFQADATGSGEFSRSDVPAQHGSTNRATVQRSKNSKQAEKEVNKNMRNATGYNSMSGYTSEEVQVASAQVGGVRGHLSGRPGDGMNNATIKDTEKLVDQLRLNKAKEKQAKKPASAPRNQAPKQDMDKIKSQIEETFSKIDDPGERQEAFEQYLKNRGYELDDDQLDEFYGQLGL